MSGEMSGEMSGGDGLWGWAVGMGCGERRGQLPLRRLLT